MLSHDPTPTGTRRLIIGNLDFEWELAREEARLHSAAPEEVVRDPRGLSLPEPILAWISALATLLRALARDGDRIWTPRPVRPSRVLPVPGLPVPILESGPLDQAATADSVLAWGESPPVANVRASARSGAGAWGEPPSSIPAASSLPLAAEPADDDTPSLAYALWSLPHPPVSVAIRAQHRAFSMETAAALGAALEGARIVASVREIEEHLRTGGAADAPEEAWVLKAPLSSAGRARLRGKGRKLERRARDRASRLLDLFGTLAFEPWMDRTADFGCPALVSPAGIRALPPHLGEVDRGGSFHGISILPARALEDRLSEEEGALLGRTVRAVAERLQRLGYVGPFTLDAWRYRNAHGQERFHPIGEINARLSFGVVARALCERLCAAAQIPPEAPARLCVSAKATCSPRKSASVVPLLAPSDREPGAAWIEVG